MKYDPVRRHLANIIAGAGVKVTDLSRKSKVSKSTIYRVLRGGRGTMYTLTLGRIITALDATLRLPMPRSPKRLTQTQVQRERAGTYLEHWGNTKH